MSWGQALGDSAYASSHAWDAQARYLGEGRCVGNGPSAGMWTLAMQVSTSLPRKSRPNFLSQPYCNSHAVILLCGCLSHLLVKVEKSGFQKPFSPAEHVHLLQPHSTGADLSPAGELGLLTHQPFSQDPCACTVLTVRHSVISARIVGVFISLRRITNTK